MATKITRRIGSDSAQTSRETPTRRVGSDEAPSSFGTRPTNIPDKYGLTTDQRRAGITTRDLAQTSEQVDTSQPSPETAQIQPPNQGNQGIVNYDAKTGISLAPGATTTDVLGNVSKQGSKFQQALTQLQGTGASQDAGEGKMLARQTLSQIAPLQPDMSATDTLLMEDKGWQALMQTKEEYFNPETQKTSLMDTYNKLYKKSGLDQLDEEIIDAKTVIEGTEDDIRNEIEQAGGFGSDSQVQALALSRNKVLLKNYNNLVAMRESKAEHLGTMMNLAEKDRAYADQQFDRMLNFDMQMLNFREKFVQNARDQYNKYTPQQLQAMLAGNPRQLAFAESILGVGQGGIAKLASMPLGEEEQLRLDNLKLQNKKLKQDLSGGGGSLSTQVVDINGKKLLVNSKTGETIKEIGATGTTGNTLQLASAQNNILAIDKLKTDSGFKGAVGPNIFARSGGGGLDQLSGRKQNFIAGVEQLRSNLNLDTLVRAKAQGATFGALSDNELQVLASAATKIGTWAIKDDGRITGYNTSEKNMQTELDTIGNLGKLDFILKGGNAADVGVQTMPDGTMWTINSDGTFTQL